MTSILAEGPFDGAAVLSLILSMWSFTDCRISLSTQCIDPPVCLDGDTWCNGVADCPDGSDEPEDCGKDAF